MRFLTLKAGDRFVGTNASAVPTLTIEQREVAPNTIFEVVDVPGGKLALRSLVTGRYLTASRGAGAIVATAESIGPFETMGLVEHKRGDVFVSVEGGRKLTLSGEVVVPGVTGAGATFTPVWNDEVMIALRNQQTCCGNTERNDSETRSIGVRWWDQAGHLNLVISAFQVLKRLRSVFPEVHQVLELFEVDAFFAGMKQGLIDADVKWEYMGNGPFFATHFYDPDSDTGLFGSRTDNALTEALRYARISSAKVRALAGQSLATSRAPFYDAGYHLGLALHYVTDLSQPMHAANFANILPTLNVFDFRHQGFENYAEVMVKTFLVGAPEPTAADLQYDGLREVLVAGARLSKEVFSKHVVPELSKKVIGSPSGPLFITTWGEEADPAMKIAIPNGRKMAAAFLLQWSKLEGVWSKAVVVAKENGIEHAPALVPFLGQVYSFWTGSYQHIRFRPEPDGTIGQMDGPRTAERPAVCVYRDALWVAWHRQGSRDLQYSSFDGKAWSPAATLANARIKDGTSPAMAVYDDRLYLIWADYGTGSQASGDGDGIWYAVYDARTLSWTAATKIAGVDTKNTPATAVWNGRLILAWTGYHDGEPLFMTSFDGAAWAAQTRLPAEMESAWGPGLAVFGGRLFLAWKVAGTGNFQVRFSSTADGKSWLAAEAVPSEGFSARKDISLTSFDGVLYVGGNQNHSPLYTTYRE